MLPEKPHKPDYVKQKKAKLFIYKKLTSDKIYYTLPLYSSTPKISPKHIYQKTQHRSPCGSFRLKTPFDTDIFTLFEVSS
jgi:hypothetical protein